MSRCVWDQSILKREIPLLFLLFSYCFGLVITHEPWVVVVMCVEPEIHAMVPASTRVFVFLSELSPFCRRDEGVPKPVPHTHAHILKLIAMRTLSLGSGRKGRHGTFTHWAAIPYMALQKLLFYQYVFSPFSFLSFLSF